MISNISEIFVVENILHIVSGEFLKSLIFKIENVFSMCVF